MKCIVCGEFRDDGIRRCLRCGTNTIDPFPEIVERIIEVKVPEVIVEHKKIEKTVEKHKKSTKKKAEK